MGDFSRAFLLQSSVSSFDLLNAANLNITSNRLTVLQKGETSLKKVECFSSRILRLSGTVGELTRWAFICFCMNYCVWSFRQGY